MNSCFYEGTVAHHRLAPVEHRFRYRMFMTYVDLAELDGLFSRMGPWSTRGPAVVRFRREDFLRSPGGDGPHVPLDTAARDLVEAETGRRPAGPIRLLTNFRMLGFGMNPVSFFYCFDAADTRVETLVAEVTNTPWRERHCYVVPCGAGGGGPAEPPVTAKAMHVSPFMPMEMHYRWRIEKPGDTLRLGIENLEGRERPFQATLSLERRPMSAWQRLRLPLRYPLVPQRIGLAIYWQAVRLWWKGVPPVAHPKYGKAGGTSAEEETAVEAAAVSERKPDYREEKASV